MRPLVLWHCWLGGRKGIRPVKNWVVGCWHSYVAICLERSADLHIAPLMPLLLTVSCFSKSQIGFTFLIAAYLGSSRKRAVKRLCVCMYVPPMYRKCRLFVCRTVPDQLHDAFVACVSSQQLGCGSSSVLPWQWWRRAESVLHCWSHCRYIQFHCPRSIKGNSLSSSALPVCYSQSRIRVMHNV